MVVGSRESRASRTGSSAGEEESTVSAHREKESQGELLNRERNCNLDLALLPSTLIAAGVGYMRATAMDAACTA